MAYDFAMPSKKFRFWYLVVKLALYIVFAVMVGVFQNHLLNSLQYFIGALMIFYGVGDFAFSVIMYRKKFYHEDKPYFGVVEIILGFGVLFANLPFEAVCVTWATWSIMREVVEIKEVVLELKRWLPRVISLVESIAIIAFSIILIFIPDDSHVTTHLRILTIELILAPLIPLLDLILTKEPAQKAKEIEKKEKSEE